MKRANGVISSRNVRQVLAFCDRNDLKLPFQEKLLPNSHTFVSERWGTVSWLDYAVCSVDFNMSISHTEICYDVTDKDHIPISFNLLIENLPAVITIENDTNRSVGSHVNWERLSSANIELYTTFTDIYCTSKGLINMIPTCNDPNCSLIECRTQLTEAYDMFTKCIIESGDKLAL